MHSVHPRLVVGFLFTAFGLLWMTAGLILWMVGDSTDQVLNQDLWTAGLAIFLGTICWPR